MKLLLDQNLSYRMLEPLEPCYPGSTQVRLIGMETADDSAIWSYAREHGYTLVTKDSDFHEMSLIHGPPPKVIWLKCGNRPKSHVLHILVEQHAAIQQFLHAAETICLELY